MLHMLRRAPARSGRRPFRRCRIECLERRDLLSAGPPQVVNVELSSTSWSAEFADYLQDADLGVNGYAIPVGSMDQSASLPWINLDQIHITFSKDVYVDDADLSVSGVNTVAYAFDDFRYDPQTQVATWTLSDAIDADRIMLNLSASGYDPVRDLDGNLLDGEWVNNSSTYASGDGTPGGNFRFNFNVLPADVNNSGANDYGDVYSIYMLDGEAIGDPAYDPFHDVDGNGWIDSADWWDEAWDRYQQQGALPVGDPAGTNNDAPTTKGFGLVQISDTENDVSVTLTAGFTDAESGSSGLEYSIVSNSNPSLFDDVTVNSQAGKLVVNATDSASGRAQIRIRATDPGGLFTEATVTIDVNYSNQGPILSVEPYYVGADTWMISGTVTDPDDDLSKFIVDFYGAFRTRCAVDENGEFEFAVIVHPDDWGEEYALTVDPHGHVSNLAIFWIGLT